MIGAAIATFDQLIRNGVITGYTVEPPPLYLQSSMPTLTYAMYAGDELSRRNLRALLGDLSILGACVTVRPVHGNVQTEDGRIERSDQVRLAARFARVEGLDAAVDRIRRRYLAGAGDGWHPASWRFPDVRVTGVTHDPSGTIRAVAHTLRVGRRSIVVLSLSPRPPHAAMASYRVRLLERWRGYLDGTQDAGGWASAPAEYQTVTSPLLATAR